MGSAICEQLCLHGRWCVNTVCMRVWYIAMQASKARSHRQPCSSLFNDQCSCTFSARSSANSTPCGSQNKNGHMLLEVAETADKRRHQRRRWPGGPIPSTRVVGHSRLGCSGSACERRGEWRHIWLHSVADLPALLNGPRAQCASCR